MTNSTSLLGVPPETGPLPESSASSVHATTATFSLQLGNGSPKAITANGWSVGDYWQFKTSTIGFTNIGVSWDQTGSGTSPRDFKLSYSLDGTTFTDWTSYSVLANGGAGTGGAWSSSTYRSAYFYSYNLSGITALNNASLVYFRLTVTSTNSVFGGTISSLGQDRVDNFTIDRVPLIPAEIVVEQPVGTNISDGGTKDFGSVAVSGNISLTFKIKNIGTAGLTGLGITIDGSDAALFTVTASPTAPVIGPFGSTTFTVQFTPTNAGVKTAALHIANNDSDENPFDINVSGRGLSFTQDTDGDGLNDAAESQLAALGFDWQVSQPSLVNALFANANGAGLYTTNQIQALNVGGPLILRNPTNGLFTLTIGVQKATNLVNFSPFPMTAPQTTINGLGELEFQFSVPDDAAFFRLESK